jgi:hypothetical protein
MKKETNKSEKTEKPKKKLLGNRTVLGKRASYREGVAWIALNDDPGSADSRDLETVSGYISTCLLADLFGVDRWQVAEDIINFRYKESKK